MEECRSKNGKRTINNYYNNNDYSRYYSYYDSNNNNNNSSSSNDNSSEISEEVKTIMMIRKGPWKPEEDQVLLNHVRKYGPRDWSSIRSKGLLLRTGKSCRLRWVNKLRPNLKNGCKFTMEEEKIVIELQAQLGNKWATIATHLAGRTDNDVKNFWSSRQKRLARLLHSQSPTRKKHKASASASSSAPSTRDRAHFHQVPKNSIMEGEAFSNAQSLNSSSKSTAATGTNALTMIPYAGSVEGSCPSFEANNTTYLNPIPLNACWNNTEFQFPFPPETQEFINRLDSDFVSPFGYCNDETALFDDGVRLFSCFGGGAVGGSMGVKLEKDNFATPDSFFEDFPSDVFDQIEPLPSPSNW